MNFSERLVALRKAKNLTQKQVADSVGMNYTAYQRYELGTREPSFPYLISLADFYGCSIDYLVGRSDEPERR